MLPGNRKKFEKGHGCAKGPKVAFLESFKGVAEGSERFHEHSRVCQRVSWAFQGISGVF